MPAPGTAKLRDTPSPENRVMSSEQGLVTSLLAGAAVAARQVADMIGRHRTVLITALSSSRASILS